MKYLSRWSPGLRNFFEKFVKPFGPHSYTLNVRSLMYKRKNLGNKSQKINTLKFSGRLFVSESMFRQNQQLTYECRQLKVPGRFPLPGSLTMLRILA